MNFLSIRTDVSSVSSVSQSFLWNQIPFFKNSIISLTWLGLDGLDVLDQPLLYCRLLYISRILICNQSSYIKFDYFSFISDRDPWINNSLQRTGSGFIGMIKDIYFVHPYFYTFIRDLFLIFLEHFVCRFVWINFKLQLYKLC